MVLSEVTLSHGQVMVINYYKSPSPHVTIRVTRQADVMTLVVPAEDFAEFTRAIQQANGQVVA